MASRAGSLLSSRDHIGGPEVGTAYLDDGVVLSFGQITAKVFPSTRLLSRIEGIQTLRVRFDNQIAIRIPGAPWVTTFEDCRLYTVRAVADVVTQMLLGIIPQSTLIGLADAYGQLSRAVYERNADYNQMLLTDKFSVRTSENNVFDCFRRILSNTTEETRETYVSRTDKSETAPEFLNRVYAGEIVAGNLTMSTLRHLDEGLWRGLRNKARYHHVSVECYLPKGKASAGAPRKELGFDPASLNPNDPKDALLLQALRRREIARESAARRRKLKGSSP